MTFPPHMSSDFASFLGGLLTKRPDRRLAWPHLLHHPFLRGGGGGGGGEDARCPTLRYQPQPQP